VLFNCPNTLIGLRRIVARLVRNGAAHDDLVQEALVHLWLAEHHQPGQSRSWYLQGCVFHLKNFLRKGRSIDSIKRRRENPGSLDECDESPPTLEAGSPVELRDEPDPHTDVLSAVALREVLQLLAHDLDPRGKAILSCLADGLSAREIASKLKLSHTAVIKRRRGIAARACKLGLARQPDRPAVVLPSRRDATLGLPRAA